MNNVSDLHKPFLVHHYVERSARQTPHKLAVTCGTDRLTYAQLESRANDVATALRRLDLPRGTCIPLLIPKSTDAIVAMIGTLKAGYAYVPLDCDSPSSRIASILEATGRHCGLTNAAGRTMVCTRTLDCTDATRGRPPLQWLDIDDLPETDAPDVDRGTLSVDLAYVLFTSGSTGSPKGVMISHQAVVDYIDWCTFQYRLSADDHVANHAPLYFDNSTFDIYTAFSAGATLHLVPPAMNAVLPRLASWIAEQKISVFFCVPSVLTLLLRSRRLKAGMLPDLRELVFAGEVVQPDVLSTWMQLFPHVRFTNMYGPTEITVDCTWHVVETPPGNEPVPIGRARPNMELFVYTESGLLTRQPGATGELWVRGLSVGYGYLGEAERTRQAFVQNPQSAFPDRLYRTGDLVRIREDGNFLFLGRADQQVKYLGHRIELGEIEAHLQALPEVEEAVVVFREGREADQQGIGALVSLRGSGSAGDVVEAIRHRVPAYMVPKRVLCTTHAFPRTANGKYDRKAILKTVFSD